MATGTCVVDWRTAAAEGSHRLDDSAEALLVPPGTWIVCREFSAGAALVVLASTTFDPDDQVRDLGEFLRWAGGSPDGGPPPA